MSQNADVDVQYLHVAPPLPTRDIEKWEQIQSLLLTIRSSVQVRGSVQHIPGITPDPECGESGPWALHPPY